MLDSKYVGEGETKSSSHTGWTKIGHHEQTRKKNCLQIQSPVYQRYRQSKDIHKDQQDHGRLVTRYKSPHAENLTHSEKIIHRGENVISPRWKLFTSIGSLQIDLSRMTPCCRAWENDFTLAKLKFTLMSLQVILSPNRAKSTTTPMTSMNKRIIPHLNMFTVHSERKKRLHRNLRIPHPSDTQFHSTLWP